MAQSKRRGQLKDPDRWIEAVIKRLGSAPGAISRTAEYAINESRRRSILLVVLLHRPITAQVNERAIVTHPTGHNALIGKGEGDSMTPITLDPSLIDWRG